MPTVLPAAAIVHCSKYALCLSYGFGLGSTKYNWSRCCILAIVRQFFQLANRRRRVVCFTIEPRPTPSLELCGRLHCSSYLSDGTSTSLSSELCGRPACCSYCSSIASTSPSSKLFGPHIRSSYRPRPWTYSISLLPERRGRSPCNSFRSETFSMNQG